MEESSPTYEYDVAISYAGEDREYVQLVAAELLERGIKVFYDEYATVDMWGSDLFTLLDEVYRKRARYTVAFISRHYVSKPWTQHERQSAQARSMIETGPYFLSVRIDDSELPGLRPTVAYVDARVVPAKHLGELICKKLESVPGGTTSSLPVIRAPRTVSQQRELLSRRPPGWEYMLYAGILWQRIKAVEPKRRDFDLGYAPHAQAYLTSEEARDLIRNTLSDMSACMPMLMRMLSPEAQILAFGEPGKPGDPEIIEHLAMRLESVYEELLDTAISLRGIRVPNEAAAAVEACALIAKGPLRQIQEFVDKFLAVADNIPDAIAAGEPISFNLSLAIDIDKVDIDRLNDEIDKTWSAS